MEPSHFVFVALQIGPQLLSLKLMEARIIEGATFREMVCRFHNMRYLSLDGTFYVKSDAMSALAAAGQQLQEVSKCWVCGLASRQSN